MTSKWMLGTAMAAVLVATPALAQNSEFGECAIEEWTQDEFLGIDVNEPGITMEEYRDCLEEAGLDLDDDAMGRYEARFEEADADDDSILVFAEVQQYREEQRAAASGEDIGEEGAPQGTVTVTQPAPDVVVEQPAPDVVVEQPEPDVAVTTPAPEVDVETQQPEVDVTQPQPDVAVEQDQPTVMIDQPEPEVTVQQPEPEVDVDAGRPAVEVETAQPDVDVEQPQPEVDVEQAELDVEVEQQNPNVAVRQAQPDVEVEQTTEVEAEMAQAETDARMDEAEAEVVAETAETIRVRVAELEGETVVNTAGEEIGDIEAILLDPTANAPVVIISVGGVFGIGDREIAFPYEDLSMAGDQIVLDTSMSEDEIGDMEEYDETAYQELPPEMIEQ